MSHVCKGCKKKIQSNEAWGKVKANYYHLEEFICNHCKEPLEKLEIYEDPVTNQLYCDTCHQSHILKKCDSCKGLVIGTAIESLERVYHPHHFVCFKCKKLLEAEYYRNEGQPVCESCFQGRKRDTCEDCGQLIEGKRSEFEGKLYHFECLKCESCADLIGKQKAVSFRNKYYHEMCYLEKKIFRCGFCMGPITGQFVKHKTKDMSVHVECFPLMKDT